MQNINDHAILALSRILGIGSDQLDRQIKDGGPRDKEDVDALRCLPIIDDAADELRNLYYWIDERYGIMGEYFDGSDAWMIEPNPMPEQEKIDKFNTIINKMLGGILYIPN